MIFPSIEPSFYFAGGSLPRDAASYVSRRADEALMSALLTGELCYILASRQTGKSSLMIHTVMRLQEEGVHTAVIDLTSLGQNLTAEQWYRGMLNRIAVHLDLEDMLDEFWHDRRALPPLERWTAALQCVLLGELSGPLVIFVDEIDMVRSLPFPSDEFFAGIRACYNRRDSEPELKRLTFCLLGVASPSELIQDVNITPFNIGTRIELHDFTDAEASILSLGISAKGRGGGALLRRALYWTAGHPYLTQRLCATIAEDVDILSERDVDALCARLFFSHEAMQGESNLTFVRNRILRSPDSAGLLERYQQIYAGQRVPDNPADPLTESLRLSGIVNKAAGYMRVRNRIYERIFNLAWIRANMPDAELRRQRAARRKGFLQAALLFGGIAVVIASLGAVAYSNYRSAAKNERDAQSAADRANNFLYIADMNLAQQAWEATPVQVEHVKELLEETRASKYRGFVWGYWNRLCHLDRLTLEVHGGPVDAVAISPDGERIATGSADGTARVWDARSGRELLTLAGHAGGVRSVAFTADGSRIAARAADTLVVWDARTGREAQRLKTRRLSGALAVASPDGARVFDFGVGRPASMRDVRTGSEIARLGGRPRGLRSAAFSHDGRWIVTGGSDNTAKVWDAGTGSLVYSLKGHAGSVNGVAVSPDGKRIVTGSEDGTAKVWAAAPGQEALVISGSSGPAAAVAFAPDGRTMAIAGARASLRDAQTGREIALLDRAISVTSVSYSPGGARVAAGTAGGAVGLWDGRTGRQLALFAGAARPGESVTCVAFSADGRRLVTGAADRTATVWDAATGKAMFTLRGHTSAVTSVAVSADATRIVTGSRDGSARIWSARGAKIGSIDARSGAVNAVAFSPDGARIVTGGADGAARVWDASTCRPILELHGHTGPVRSVAYSPDGKRILTASDDTTAKVWNGQLGKEILTVKGHTRAVNAAVFSPQYDRIATASDDGTVRVLFSDNADRETQLHLSTSLPSTARR